MPTRPHILVIEDDPLVSEVVIDALEDRYDTSHAETAPDGLERLRAGGVDLVLLDCTLPGGLGELLLPAADGGRVPVVLMSGNPGNGRTGAGLPAVRAEAVQSVVADGDGAGRSRPLSARGPFATINATE